MIPKCKEYRFRDNPKEEELYDKFVEGYINDPETLGAIIFGWSQDGFPNDILTEREKAICSNLIQWLGSSVGQYFLSECGFKLKSNT